MTREAAPSLAARVQALCTEPGWKALFGALRTRLEAGGEPATLTLPVLDAPARRALADLLGRRRLPGRRPRVTVEAIDQALRASRLAAGLRDVLEAHAGPLRDLRAQRRAVRDAWEDVHAQLAGHPVVRARPVLGDWVEGLRADGLLARTAGAPEAGAALACSALAVVERLPAAGCSLPVLAAAAAGDPHALDPGTSLSTLVLRAAARLTGGRGMPESAAGRRALWAKVGVVCDPLSSDVLVLGLRARGDGLLARTLALHAEAGEPLRLTLRALERHALALGGEDLHVCENPAVLLAAADELGAGARPLLCTAGMPGAAADHVLAAARRAGATVRFHADFDGGGIRIGNLLVERHGARAWRMGAADYEAGLARAGPAAPLAATPAPASWDADLAPALAAAGRVLAEEQVLAPLLADLA